MNLYAGYHVMSPDSSQKVESVVMALVALLWTFYDNWSKSAKGQPSQATPKYVPILAFILFLSMASGCARFVGKTETRADGTSFTTFRAYTFFDSKNELSKLAIRQTTTNKLNQSFGISAVSQESSSTNVNALLIDVVGAAIKAAKTP
jgi:hypothetical protein